MDNCLITRVSERKEKANTTDTHTQTLSYVPHSFSHEDSTVLQKTILKHEIHTFKHHINSFYPLFLTRSHPPSSVPPSPSLSLPPSLSLLPPSLPPSPSLAHHLQHGGSSHSAGDLTLCQMNLIFIQRTERKIQSCREEEREVWGRRRGEEKEGGRGPEGGREGGREGRRVKQKVSPCCLRYMYLVW